MGTPIENVTNLHPPPEVLEIARRLGEAGFEAWCVGGAIRDALLGHPHLDWDLATSATPQQVRGLFGSRLTIPVGIEFGTVGVLDDKGRMHEVTTFRRDVRTDGRHAEVEFGASLEMDLARRDFTINAIAYSPASGEIRDPFDGRGDLKRGLVRAVGDADARMREDRLRALRAIRFASRFGFTIDPDTLRAITASGPYLGRLSPERVKQELDKTLEQVRRPSVAFRLWQSTGAFATLIPALAATAEVDLSVPDFLALPGPSRRPGRRLMRFAGLLAAQPSAEAVRVLTELRGSRQEIHEVGVLVARWRTLGPLIEDALRADRAPDDALVRAWVADIGRLNIGAFARLADGVWSARRALGFAAPRSERFHALYRRLLRSSMVDAVDLGALRIDGDDLRRAGIPAGPRLGKILQALLAAVIQDPARNTAEWLLHEAKRLAAADAGPAPE